MRKFRSYSMNQVKGKNAGDGKGLQGAGYRVQGAGYRLQAAT